MSGRAQPWCMSHRADPAARRRLADRAGSSRPPPLPASATMTDRLPDEPYCERCNDTGEVACRVTTLTVIGPGPVPEDAKGIAGFPCDKCHRGIQLISQAYHARESARNER